ncbi:MAG: hypothetical protein Fur002_08830 [Anaerolineales bacterium]
MKRKNNGLKYLGYGFLGGVVLALTGIGISAAVILLNENARALILPPTPSASPVAPAPLLLPPATEATAPLILPAASATFTSTPTLTYLITPAATLAPSATPTLSLAEQKTQTGELAFWGNLSITEQINLYNASLTFIRKTTQESKSIGEEIAGQGYGSPTLICGPLSIAILQRAEILSANVTPYEFWLLNPFVPKDRALADKTFPAKEYEHHVIRTALNKIDYKGFPLYPGDFLYIKDGDGGTFEHMLVVNRVDALGRAYAVTNFYTPQGFIIDETMLYDPNEPNLGIFKWWTRKKNAEEGATGFGGFELWRKK